ncbi:hypothetical protein [Streptomyces liliifuscus]|uniref:Uncharacterized protein n=1 Tax=Streptomyces liliifuscus TaxID=2797636 RepID=A0A7T7L211_9ACTN|nr:hypothetical protein [Streptomyces liliifuscus]QQM44992.1 hypothetical protein JEQ17_40045 [Streptomyces liliifuscus]
MSNCTVPMCPRDAPDGVHACPYHADELRAWLAELPGQTHLLAEFVEPAGRPRAGRLGGSGRAHAPVPVDLRVLTLLGPGHPQPPSDDPEAGGTVPIRALLDGWAGRVAYDYPAVHRDPYGTAHTQPCEAYRAAGGPTITGWCAWLTAYLPYALTRPWIGELHQQLGDLLARIRDFTHATPHTHRKVAPCPTCDAFALVTVDGRWGITCTACGHHLEPDAYDQHATEYLRTAQQPA